MMIWGENSTRMSRESAIDKGSKGKGANMADDEIQNQIFTTINKKWKRLTYAGTGDKSREAIGNTSKYIRDANDTPQSKSVILVSVPPNP